ncbi:MAG: choice-of-anchor D domain-containing protein, partial [Candidatus Hydrothermae bacterium]|nr:choice-of-anchor D domain-containing protein [Candidatus Hydrothermae bacterium]
MRKLLIPLITASTWLFAGNTMAVHDETVNVLDTVTVHLDIINDTPFVAFQVDIPLPSNLTYVGGSISLTSRAVDHTIGASVLGDTVLRIIAYSSNNSAFLGDSGDVATFRLAVGPVPGNFLLDLSDPIIGDSTGNNIISDTVNGTITVLGPDIDIQTQEIIYDSTPLGDYNDRALYIQNMGNETLTVYLAVNDSAFLILDGDTIHIPPYGQEDVTIRFDPYRKGDYRDTLTVSSDDPDENVIPILLNARCYTVNELHVGNISASSGDTAVLALSINNQEPFVAFQCDLSLPEPMHFIEGSESLSLRAVDHNISASILDDSTLRIVAYSPTNTPFSGDDGEIAYLKFFIFGTGGYYFINAENVIIGDTSGENITSWYYGGNLHIYAPDISVPDTFSFGDISLPDTVVKQVYIYNAGDDTLVIDSVTVASSDFWISGHMPAEIPPSSQDYVEVASHSSIKGNRYGLLEIRSNDPDERTVDIVLTAYAYAPNYLLVENSVTAPGETVTVKIDVDNYEPFVAFQFDLHFPEQFSYVENSARLTDRAVDHTLAVNLIEDGLLRAVAYSMTQAAFQGDSGTVLELDFVVSDGAPTMLYELTLTNAILGDSSGTNILWASQNGYITVDGVPPGIPSPIAPDEGSFLNSGTPQFIWSSVEDSIAGIAGYELEYADNPEFSSAIDTELIDTSFTPSEPLTDTTWYWRVRARDAAGNLSNWSEVRNFSIDTQAPGAPTPLSPADGEWLDTLTVSFSWSESGSPARKADN